MHMEEKYSIELLTERLDSIEKLLKMLVVNSLADDLNDINNGEPCDNKCELSSELKKFLKDHNLIAVDTRLQNGFTLVYIETEEFVKYRIKDYQTLNCKIKDTFYGTIPVFKFTFLNTRRRKRFMEEDISFCIHEKEIHICARKA